VTEEGWRLILVRHSLPKFVTGVPAGQWHLSAEGRLRCQRLADRLAAYDLALIVTSEEPKAVETGQIVADILGLPLETASDLHEHERGVVMDMGSQGEFRARVARLFQLPDELVMGYETANQAHARFAAAVDLVVKRRAAKSLAIVSHGTVMTLFVARANGLDPVPFWRGLGLPAFAVLSLPDLKLTEVVHEVKAVAVRG
jgi:broad specificity phosphatase PhoE